MSELDKYKQFWFVTITPYGKDIEPNVPDKKQVISDFKKLSEHLGTNTVAIRYDPIFINDKFDVSMHIKCFERLLNELKGYTEDCTISFLDMYEKVKRNAPNLRPPTTEEQIEIAKAFSKIGKENNITIHACCEKEYLKDYGLDITGCMSQEIVEKAIQNKLNAPKNNSKRMQCNCLMGNDIGAYNTCMHLCKYCYANANQVLVKENVKNHNPDSPFLIGELEKEDKNINRLIDTFDEDTKNHITMVMATDYEIENIDKAVDDILLKYEKERLDNRKQEILKQLEIELDGDKKKQLGKELSNIIIALAKIK